MKGIAFKKTVVICWWESKTQKNGMKQVDKETLTL